MLLTEAGHISKLVVFDEHIMQMNKTTFYFILTVLVIADIVQNKYKKRLDEIKKKEEEKELS